MNFHKCYQLGTKPLTPEVFWADISFLNPNASRDLFLSLWKQVSVEIVILFWSFNAGP